MAIIARGMTLNCNVWPRAKSGEYEPCPSADVAVSSISPSMNHASGSHNNAEDGEEAVVHTSMAVRAEYGTVIVTKRGLDVKAGNEAIFTASLSIAGYSGSLMSRFPGAKSRYAKDEAHKCNMAKCDISSNH